MGVSDINPWLLGWILLGMWNPQKSNLLSKQILQLDFWLSSSSVCFMNTHKYYLWTFP